DLVQQVDAGSFVRNRHLALEPAAGLRGATAAGFFPPPREEHSRMTVTTTIHTNLGDITVESQNAANLNSFWGGIASQLAQSGIMGEHTSEAGAFTPNAGDGGRQGVGNLSKDDPRFDNPTADSQTNLADGGQGFHAVFQAARLGDPAHLPPG